MAVVNTARVTGLPGVPPAYDAVMNGNSSKITDSGFCIAGHRFDQPLFNA
jgi:hypothetical protein